MAPHVVVDGLVDAPADDIADRRVRLKHGQPHAGAECLRSQDRETITGDGRGRGAPWPFLAGGAVVRIDLKVRRAGCSKWWANGPELALEIWSDIARQVAGWTLDESKQTDYTLHLFDPADSTLAYLLPFQLLRLAFRTRYREWTASYRREVQTSNGWQSECVFVPASVVTREIERQMKRMAPDQANLFASPYGPAA